MFSLFLVLWLVLYTQCVHCRTFMLALFNIFSLLLIKKICNWDRLFLENGVGDLLLRTSLYGNK